ncbi:MAG: cyclodeaminase/cyclohydrolase family protein [Bacteroidales bacterium]|nr:cyclodeaminase/cyclohydrolase family protein [Bacteroidales bacterium]
MNLIELTLNKFVEATASSEPVPGGGSVSALCGAMAAALTKMVAGLTIGKKKYADAQPQMEAIAEKLGMATNLLARSVDLDSDAYDQVFQAYKLPKDTDEQKEMRTAAIQHALKNAATVPFSVCKLVHTFLPDIEQVAEKGNQNAITDAYVASLCARTAVLGAGANVRINLTSITDAEFVNEMIKDLTVIEHDAQEMEGKVRKLLDKALA